MIDLICPNCLNKFSTKDKRAKYCSKPCSNSGRSIEKKQQFENPLITKKETNSAITRKESHRYLQSVIFINDHRPVEVIPTDHSPAFIQFALNGQEYGKSAERWESEIKEKDVITLAGNGCSLKVEKGKLVLRSGFSCSTVTERERYFSRGVH
ncbi:MAG: hypothetical protein LM517_03895 [Nitrosomonas sp.]|nr:hypothetical protein [Nitrosomonas sp.]